MATSEKWQLTEERLGALWKGLQEAVTTAKALHVAPPQEGIVASSPPWDGLEIQLEKCKEETASWADLPRANALLTADVDKLKKELEAAKVLKCHADAHAVQTVQKVAILTTSLKQICKTILDRPVSQILDNLATQLRLGVAKSWEKAAETRKRQERRLHLCE